LISTPNILPMLSGEMNFQDTIRIAGVKTFPIRTSRGNSPKMALGIMPTRPALLIKIEDNSGCYGWGEIWANFPTRANTHKANIVEDVIETNLLGFSFSDPREVQEALRNSLAIFFLHIGQSQVFEHILAGIDMALWDLTLRHKGVSFTDFMGLPSSWAQSYASSINAEDLGRLIPLHAGMGHTYFKLKIGFVEHGNAHIVENASKLAPDGSSIMVDSNQSWTLEQAKVALRDIEEYEPYFAEEALRADAPLSDWEELAKATIIPLAAGENIYGIEDFLTMTQAGLKVLQPDVAKWGGVSGALDLAQTVPEDVLIWPHFMGTAVGQVAALSISAAVGKSSTCEVDVNDNPLRTELCGDVIAIEGGQVELPSDPGLVHPPTIRMLTTFADQI